MKKLLLPIESTQGGVRSFLESFRDLASIDYEVIPLSKVVPDVSLAVAYHPFIKILLAQKKAGTKIIHRLDGLPDPNLPGAKTIIRSMCDTMQIADHIVFQSEFSREVWKEYVPANKKTSIITNGKNLEIFNPFKKTPPAKKIRLLAVSHTLYKSKNIDKIISISKSVPNSFHLTCIGNFLTLKEHLKLFEQGGMELVFESNKKLFSNLPNVTYRPTVENNQIIKEFNNSDYLLFPAINEACSNLVIESLSSGLPVIFNKEKSGSTADLVGPSGVAFDFENYSSNKQFFDTILSQNLEELNSIVFKNYKKYDFRNTYEAYKKIIEELL